MMKPKITVSKINSNGFVVPDTTHKSADWHPEYIAIVDPTTGAAPASEVK